VLREGAPGEVYNVGGDDERENVEIVGRILELTGADRR
jgi:dTDP-D-glucose 4,6-dehydratase